ncbi:MAG: hypothetical protein U9R49_11335, partial [Bacteroidota bacterium]|nr:hypothetical protein [Bacteroidota bacterium]
MPVIVSVIVIACGPAGRTGINWQYYADLDGDGSLETVKVVDLNANGRPDRMGDLHLTGQGDSLTARLWTEAQFDLDGEPDELRIYIDRNKDGRIDTTEGWLWRCLDLDDDEACDDRDSDLHELDLAGKGFTHQRIRYQDTDGDGDADLRCDYPTYNLFTPDKTYRYITSDRCMRQTWWGLIHGFGQWLYLDEDDDNSFPPHKYPISVWDFMDADGAGTNLM